MAGRQISVPPTSAPARPPPSRRRGRPSTEQPRRTQAALLIVGICVFMYFLFSNSPHLFEFVTGASSSSSPTKITDADVAALASTVHMMEESGATLLDEVGGHYAQQVMLISMAMEVELMKLVQADEDDQDGAGDRLHAYIHHPQTVAVVRALEEAAQYMYHSLRTLLVMGDAAHVVVDEEDNGDTPIHERIFDWFAVAVHLHAALLPEVYLQLDNTPRHATVLLRGVHLLSLHLQHTSEEMMFGDRPCRHLRHHSTSRWSTFCEGSLNTRAKMLRRIAATLEELIVLYPTCAPLRAHYAVALTLHHLGTREASTTTSAMNVVRSTLEKSEKGAYEQVDEVQMHVLHLLQLVLQQPTTTMEEMEQRWLEKAMGDDQVCSITAGEEWPGTTFSGEAQPPLVHRMGMQILAPHLLSRLTEDDDHAHLREVLTRCI